MLNQSFLNYFEHLIGSTADICEIVEDLSDLIETEIPVESFIDKFLLY